MLDSGFALEELNPRMARGLGGRFYGVYTALVTQITDPDGQGRVKVRLPWSPDSEQASYDVWARLATLMAGSRRGSWWIPDVEDEVLISFEAGDPRRPYVLGSLWNGRDEPPQSMDTAGQNNLKTLYSRNGVEVTLDDSDGRERLTLKTPGGQEMTLEDGPAAVDIHDSNGNSVRMEASGVTVNTSATVTINGSLVNVSAGMLTVDAGISRFSGLVQADTVITNSVISASYTPGAGNIW